MSENKQIAAQINQAGQKLVLQSIPIPSPQPGQLLIQVEASTVNPSDRYQLEGVYGPMSFPFTGGKEGTGRVIEANGEDVQNWIGKRVVFSSGAGGVWASFVISNPSFTFEIDEDVPLSCAASGVINPLTTIGFIETFKHLGKKGGIIHTAAASSLGRQLNRLAKKEGIPILNLVRRQEQLDLLKSQGASHVIITEGNWIEEFKVLVKEHNFDTVFDALGGGPVSELIISNLPPKANYFAYGTLERKPLIITNARVLFSGINVGGFFLTNWWLGAGKEVQERVRKEYSDLLKNVLTTKTYKELGLAEINEALELSVSKAHEGKVLIKIQ